MTVQKFSHALGSVDEKYVDEAITYTQKAKTPFLIKWGTLAACLVLTIVASIFILNGNFIKGPEKPDPKYGYTVAYVGSADAFMTSADALNYELLTNNNGSHLPVFKIDSLEELRGFVTRYEDTISVNEGYDNILSFQGALEKAQWDREGFYAEHSLLMVYIPAESASYRFGIQEVKTTDSALCIHIGQTNKPQTTTDDEAGWFVFIQIEKDEASGYTTFDAVLE